MVSLRVCVTIFLYVSISLFMVVVGSSPSTGHQLNRRWAHFQDVIDYYDSPDFSEASSKKIGSTIVKKSGNDDSDRRAGKKQSLPDGPRRYCAQCVSGSFTEYEWLFSRPGKFAMTWKDVWTLCSNSPETVLCSGPCYLGTVEKLTTDGAKFVGFMSDCSDNIFVSKSDIPKRSRGNSFESQNRLTRIVTQFKHRVNHTFVWYDDGVNDVMLLNERLGSHSASTGLLVLVSAAYLVVLVLAIIVAIACYDRYRRRNAHRHQNVTSRQIRSAPHRAILQRLTRYLYSIPEETELELMEHAIQEQQSTGEYATIEDTGEHLEEDGERQYESRHEMVVDEKKKTKPTVAKKKISFAEYDYVVEYDDVYDNVDSEVENEEETFV